MNKQIESFVFKLLLNLFNSFKQSDKYKNVRNTYFVPHLRNEICFPSLGFSGGYIFGQSQEVQSERNQGKGLHLSTFKELHW